MYEYKNPEFYHHGDKFRLQRNDQPLTEYEDKFLLLVEMDAGSWRKIATVGTKKEAIQFARQYF